MKFKVFSFIPLLFLPISIISTEHNFFELEKISIVNYQKNEIENKKIDGDYIILEQDFTSTKNNTSSNLSTSGNEVSDQLGNAFLKIILLIVGLIFGGILILAIISILIYFIFSKRRKKIIKENSSLKRK
ncbi:unknown [Firmicutes bacterium CAG:345]|nr:unknown [Firmicutes bacterium CAG:345]